MFKGFGLCHYMVGPINHVFFKIKTFSCGYFYLAILCKKVSIKFVDVSYNF